MEFPLKTIHSLSVIVGQTHHRHGRVMALWMQPVRHNIIAQQRPNQSDISRVITGRVYRISDHQCEADEYEEARGHQGHSLDNNFSLFQENVALQLINCLWRRRLFILSFSYFNKLRT